jgi:Icc protein
MSGPATPRALRLLQLTDCHLPAAAGELVQGLDTDASLRAVLDQGLTGDPPYDLVLLTGDLVEQPTPASYALLSEHLDRLSVPYLCLPGNHDEAEAMRRCLPHAATAMAPSRSYGDWRILALDSTIAGRSDGFLRDEQLALVQSVIAEDPAVHLLVAVHHHPVPCGSPWMDAMMIGNGSALVALLQGPGPGSRTVIFGHIHQAFDATVAGVRLLGSPATSCQFEPHTQTFKRAALAPGYRWLELEPSGTLRTGVAYLNEFGFPCGVAATVK